MPPLEDLLAAKTDGQLAATAPKATPPAVAPAPPVVQNPAPANNTGSDPEKKA